MTMLIQELNVSGKEANVKHVDIFLLGVFERLGPYCSKKWRLWLLPDVCT
jgi:hypothetical protein